MYITRSKDSLFDNILKVYDYLFIYLFNEQKIFHRLKTEYIPILRSYLEALDQNFLIYKYNFLAKF